MRENCVDTPYEHETRIDHIVFSPATGGAITCELWERLADISVTLKPEEDVPITLLHPDHILWLPSSYKVSQTTTKHKKSMSPGEDRLAEPNVSKVSLSVTIILFSPAHGRRHILI